MSIKLFVVFPYLFSVSWICRDILSLILDINCLYFLYFFSLAKSLSTYWFVFQRICFIDFFQFSYCQFHWFLSDVIFLIFFQFVYSSFSSFLRWELRLLILDFLHFKCKHLVIKKIRPLSFGCTAQILMCQTFIFIQSNVFCIFLEISSLWLSCYLEVFCLIFIVLKFSYCILILAWFHYGEKHFLNDFNCFKFAEACFIAQDIVCLGECSTGIWKKGCIQLLVVECSV